MKILIPICFLIYFNPLLSNESEDLHYTKKIFSNKNNRLIKLTIKNECIDSDFKGFNDIKAIHKFNSIEDCNSYVKQNSKN